MITIDGSFGEGGGQILRSSLTLSLITGKPISIKNIRSGRSRPGLLRQHLTAVNAAAEIGGAEVHGAKLGSTVLEFAPRHCRGGEYRCSIGTAGSCTLVLQTILPALLTADDKSVITLEGGTHNPFAPPYDFLVKTFLPILERMGIKVTAELERPGFYPNGGGRIKVFIEPNKAPDRIDIMERGGIVQKRIRCLISRLPRKIAEREINAARSMPPLQDAETAVEELDAAYGPGNVLFIEIESENITEFFTGFGKKGLPAEKVAEKTARSAAKYMESDAPVGEHLADQLLIPMAIAGGGRFRTVPLTLHTKTNIEVIGRFLDIKIKTREISDKLIEVEIG